MPRERPKKEQQKQKKKKKETDHSRGSQGERGSGMDGHREGFLDANCYIWNGWAMGPYCTAQETVCDRVTVLYNRT